MELCVFTYSHITELFSPSIAPEPLQSVMGGGGETQVHPIKETGTVWGPLKGFFAGDWLWAVRQPPLESRPPPQRAVHLCVHAAPSQAPSLSELPVNTAELPPSSATPPDLRSPKTIS